MAGDAAGQGVQPAAGRAFRGPARLRQDYHVRRLVCGLVCAALRVCGLGVCGLISAPHSAQAGLHPEARTALPYPRRGHEYPSRIQLGARVRCARV
jgi:hypothetical protein